MPYNEFTHKFYSINYSELLSYLTNHIPLFFDNASSQHQYFSRWISLLQKCDAQDTSYLHSSKNLIEHLSQLEKEPEIYQHCVYVGNTILYLHYRISHVNFLLSGIPNSRAESVNIHEFISSAPSIDWSMPDDFNEHYPLNITPVVAVEFPTNNSCYLIIDGNHRIAEHIARKSATIPTFFIDIPTVHSFKLLTMSFDLAFYLFWNDTYLLSSQKRQSNISDSELNMLSLFRTANNDSIW